jgi:hypothetical protein
MRGTGTTSKEPTMNENGAPTGNEGRSFRDCVRDCARDARMVAMYNELSGSSLRAPIEALLRHQEGKPGPDPETEEGAQLAGFILFVYARVWRHVRRPRQHRTWPMKGITFDSSATGQLNYSAL